MLAACMAAAAVAGLAYQRYWRCLPGLLSDLREPIGPKSEYICWSS
jgi:hypothetical protein